MNETPSKSPESGSEASQIEAKKRRDLIKALILTLGFGAAGAYLELNQPGGRLLNNDEKGALEEKVKKQTLSVDEVKKYYEGMGTHLSDARAEQLYEAAKAHMAERSKLIASGDLIEILPGAHFDKRKIVVAAAKSEIARRVLVNGEKEPAYVLTADKEIQLGVNKEPVIAAKPFADALSEVNAEMKKDGKGQLKIEDCFRSDITTAIIKAGAGDARATEMGSGFHGAGLACDIWNIDDAEPYLTQKGIVGGCAGTMPGSDGGHASAGEMDAHSPGFITMCTALPHEGRVALEKTERITRPMRKKIGEVLGNKWTATKDKAKKGAWEWLKKKL